ALFSLDSAGLVVEGNDVEDCGNNGIQIWRSQPGDDRSTVRGNRVSRIRADAGGDGQNGNGISLFRAGGVIIEGNQLRDCAMTFIRNNSGSGVQILGNQGRRCGEVALYSEFAFEGTIMANNLVEDCAQGANITNLDHGGRLAVFANNIIRDVRRGLAPNGKEPIGGIGVHVEAEAAVTGNVIEDASDIGISLGWSWGMRNLACTGNVVRKTGTGIAISLVPKERNALIANNLIDAARNGAIVGTEYGKPVTGDLARTPDAKAAGVTVANNAVR
ncbi:TIGR03808 family TAT-translocated repetitive protein, partial [Bosea sp. CER48]|uniref:TIGR03808 family TAT-translocated repetitive protein n=1 Tax=Bosea sp. CER48 TaxID=3377035 RepID=UPI0038074A55